MESLIGFLPQLYGVCCVLVNNMECAEHMQRHNIIEHTRMGKKIVHEKAIHYESIQPIQRAAVARHKHAAVVRALLMKLGEGKKEY